MILHLGLVNCKAYIIYATIFTNILFFFFKVVLALKT